MKKKNIVICICVVLFIIFFIYLFINSRKDIEYENSNDTSEENKLSEELKENISYKIKNKKVIFTMQPYESYSSDEWKYFIDGSQMIDIDEETDLNCTGVKRLNGDCDGTTTFTLTAVSSGNATIWITTQNDIYDANKTNTVCYDLMIDEDLNIEVEEIEFVDIGY